MACWLVCPLAPSVWASPLHSVSGGTFSIVTQLPLELRLLLITSWNVSVGSHSSHVPYARDLCEAWIYAADTASEEESSIHQPTTHTYHNAVILVPVD